jgi:hypothetical protein
MLKLFGVNTKRCNLSRSLVDSFTLDTMIQQASGGQAGTLIAISGTISDSCEELYLFKSPE